MRALVLSAVLATACASAPSAPIAPTSAASSGVLCHAGAYLFADRSHLVLTPAPNREGVASGLRSLFVETGAQGNVASTDAGWVINSPAPDGRMQIFPLAFGACADDQIYVSIAGERLAAQRMRFEVVDTTFTSRGTTLHGALILPSGQRPTRVVVQVHGSERSSALSFARWRYIWPALGVGVFIYDKRGTSASEGEYTQDFDVLAEMLPQQ